MSSHHSARISEVAERQAFVARLLESAKAEQLLLLDQPNVTWFAGASLARGILDPQDEPCLIVAPNARWLVCSNVDSQRIFDTYLDQLGFQLKEWPWHQGRDQLLADLCQNRIVACDRLLRDSISVTNDMRNARMTLSALAQDSLTLLGHDLAHALEATCRNFDPGTSELEVAGHLGHRLFHRGIEPVSIHVAADRRLANDPRPGFTAQTITQGCTVIATVRRDGLHATAARTVALGPPSDEWKHEIEMAGTIAAARAASVKAGATIHDIHEATQKVATALGAEHAWRTTPIGWFTGLQPVEANFAPQSTQTLDPGHAIVLQTRIGAALHLDTHQIGSTQVNDLVPPEEWPVRRYKLVDRFIDLPDVLVR